MSLEQLLACVYDSVNIWLVDADTKESIIEANGGILKRGSWRVTPQMLLCPVKNVDVHFNTLYIEISVPKPQS